MYQNIFGYGNGKIDTMIHKTKSGICNLSTKVKHPPHNFSIEQRTGIVKHIKSFPLYELLFYRKKTSLMYLSSPAVNIQNMHDSSEKGIDNFPSFWLYKDVFNKIGCKFKMPYLDKCKT